MSRRKIKKSKRQNITNQDLINQVEEAEGKAKRALRATGSFFKNVGCGIGSGVKTGVQKGIVPASCATGRLFKNAALGIKESMGGWAQARRAVKELKALDQEAQALANIMGAAADKMDALEALHDLKEKVESNLKAIDRAIAALQEKSDDGTETA